MLGVLLFDVGVVLCVVCCVCGASRQLLLKKSEEINSAGRRPILRWVLSEQKKLRSHITYILYLVRTKQYRVWLFVLVSFA